MESKIDTTLKKKGVVKGVPTADTVIFQGPVSKTGTPLEKTLHLYGIQAPTLADIERPDRKEEAYAFEAREFLRKKLIGQQVFFYSEYKIGDREYGRVLVGDTDVAELLLAEGYVSLLNDIHPEPVNLARYTAAADKAFAAKKGIYNEDAKVLAAHTRQFSKLGDPAKYVEKHKGKPLKGIVEEFRSNMFNVYLPDINSIVRLALPGITIPIMGYKAGLEVRFFIDTHFLQRDVEITLESYEERSDYFVGHVKSLSSPNYNLIRELLREGYARLNPDAYKVFESADHKTFKQAQEEAIASKLRVWAKIEFEKKASTTQGRDEEFQARVVEAHSGDSLTVENLNNGEQLRVFLANIRAPGMGNPKKAEQPKPWAWEAKEFVRKESVGKKVKVEVEFSRKIQLKGEEETAVEEKEITSVSIILPNDKNLAEQVVAHGFANVVPPRSDDAFTKYMKQLSDAEEEAKTKKVGLYSTKTPVNLAKFTDYSQPRQTAKAKQFFDFAKTEPSITGVVEAVLSGSLFKVRLHKQNCFVMFSLSGIRTYSMEKNVPQYEKFAKEALQFSKDQILQRDVELELNSITPKGVIQGALTVGKKNFAHTLLENGLAYVESMAKAEQKYAAQYKNFEKIAEDRKTGIWGAGIPVRSMGGGRTSYAIKPLSETKVGSVIEVLSPEEFYIHAKDAKKNLDLIAAELAKLNESKLEQPVKKGIPCIAKFSEDGKWYRARIEKAITSVKFGVVFTDYGNYDEVSYDNLRKISPALLSIPAQAQRCGLAYVQAADKRTETFEESGERLRELIYEKEVTLQFVYESENTKYAIVSTSKSVDIKTSVNAKLVGEGLVRLAEHITQIPTDQLIVLRDEDENARVKKAGGWSNNDFFEEEEDDY